VDLRFTDREAAKMKRFLLLGVALSGMFLTGCVAGNGYAAVRFGPPPPPRYGVMGYAPGPGFVWTDGYWDWRGGRWFWVDGRWREDGHRYRFHRGYWR
jgi:hypothetical protein